MTLRKILLPSVFNPQKSASSARRCDKKKSFSILCIVSFPRIDEIENLRSLQDIPYQVRDLYTGFFCCFFFMLFVFNAFSSSKRLLNALHAWFVCA